MRKPATQKMAREAPGQTLQEGRGDRVRLDLDQLAAATSEGTGEVLDIDVSLAGLANADPQAGELVKLRSSAGLSIPRPRPPSASHPAARFAGGFRTKGQQPREAGDP